MKSRPTLLNQLLDYCVLVQGDADTIRQAVGQRGPQAREEEGPWGIPRLRLDEMMKLLEDFPAELGELRGASATNAAPHGGKAGRA